MTTPEERIKQYEEERRKETEVKKAAFKKLRAKVREDALGKALVDQSGTVFTGGFDGYGDSGSYYVNTGSADIDTVLEAALDIYVTFDWYNDDGGGGDISWDITTDEMIINGYCNVTTQETMMDEESV